MKTCKRDRANKQEKMIEQVRGALIQVINL